MSTLFLLSSDYYDECGHIRIHDSSLNGIVFAKVPVEFIRKGGLDSWDFVLDIVNMLVDPTPNCPGMIKTASGVAIDLTARPTEGHYIYVQTGL